MFALLTIPRGRPRDDLRLPETGAAYGIVIRPPRPRPEPVPPAALPPAA
jgi:hypothetical protein